VSRAIDISASGWQSRAYQFEPRNLKFTAEFETNFVSQNAAYAGLHFFVHHVLNNGQKILIAHVLYSLCKFAFSDCLCFNCACTHAGKVREVRTCTSEQSCFRMMMMMSLTGIIKKAAAQSNKNHNEGVLHRRAHAPHPLLPLLLLSASAATACCDMPESDVALTFLFKDKVVGLFD
jgi:hypothetical protein